MRTYTVHLPPPFTAAAREPLVIAEGFNWWAFLFSGLWAFVNRLWLLGLAMIAATTAIAWGLDVLGLGEMAQGVVTLAVAVYIGFESNDWHRAHLARKGWKAAGVVAAADRDGALRRYLDFAAIGAA
ncbi:MAG: hypothetical protein RL477_1258 [Pseudomonadota bacterium]|jgi:hypothetical protein